MTETLRRSKRTAEQERQRQREIDRYARGEPAVHVGPLGGRHAVYRDRPAERLPARKKRGKETLRRPQR